MRFFKSLSSMTTGLVLLALVGTASAIGSSLWPEYFFRAWPFRLLLALLLINMVLCTINTSGRFFRRRTRISRDWRLLLRTLGLVMLHAGIVFILVGASLYSWLGHSVQLSIREGDTVQIENILPVTKPFALKLDKFYIEFHHDGSPAQYYADLQVLEGDRTALEKTIKVNYPLVYNGVKFYQSSYGYLTEVLVRDGEETPRTLLAQDGDFIPFDNTGRTLKVFRYIPDFDPEAGMAARSDEPLNPRVIYSVYEDEVLLGIGAAPFGEAISIDDGVFIEFQRACPYTVLTVKTDPGLPLVAAGGLFTMLGVCLILFGPSGRKKEV
jgi:cytochrome c biogenesis protein